MAYYDTTWYANSVGYTAVTAWAATTAIVAGALRRQLTAPAVNSERVFVCIVAGTTGSTEPTWVLTRGAKTTDGTVTWMECTGIAALNSDITNTINWTAAKAIGTPSLGTVIQRNNGASYQICTTAGGAMGASEPAFSDTAGVTTTDSSTTWTSLGVVGNWTAKGAAPHARIFTAAATNWFAAGNTIYIGDNHAELNTTGLLQFVPAGSTTTVGKFICHNHTGSYPPTSANLMTTATVTAASGQNVFLFNGSPTGMYYFYGITFSSSGNQLTFTNNVNSFVVLDHCSLQLTSGAGSSINLAAGCYHLFNNTTVKFNVAAHNIQLGAGTVFVWQNTAPIFASGSITTLTQLIIASGSIVLEALDLSQLTGPIFNTSAASSISYLIKDCLLNAAMTTPAPAGLGVTEQFVRCDSASAAYKSSRYEYEGAETTETSITRVGGAADPTGQAQSRKIVTTANSQWLRPFKAEPYAIWNPRTAANVTVTVCGTVNSGVVPNNDDIWMDVEYLGSSATPLGTIVNTTKANLLAANAAVASDGSTWNGGGSGAGWSPFKLVATLSSPQPGLPGYIHVRPKVAKPSATFYLDPQVTLS